MNRGNIKSQFLNVLILFVLLCLAWWGHRCLMAPGPPPPGAVNFFLGFVLLAAFVCARILQTTRLPMISGYIFAGVVAGPYVSGFLSIEMVQGLKLVDDLALSFIALTAGGALKLNLLRTRAKSIFLNIAFQTVFVFVAVFGFVVIAGRYYQLLGFVSSVEVTAMAILLGMVAIARSPSSAIAIISECRATGPFTDTVLGVTVAMDVLIIIFFTVALTLSRVIVSGSAGFDYQALAGLLGEMSISLIIGTILGKAIAVYIRRAGHDLTLFLLFIAFGISKTSIWIGAFMVSRFHIHLNLEPLLICMCAGFVVQNFSESGGYFMHSLEQVALPIYVLFFSLAGASLNLEALLMSWPFALSLVVVRAAGVWGGTWLAGTVSKDPRRYNRNAWMAYLTQAGVAIGLAQLAQRQFPDIGVFLNTVVLAVISVNQILGPITFKLALNRVGEAKG